MSLVSGRRFKFVLAIFFCSHALHYWHHEAKATQMSSLYPNVALKKLTFQGPGTRSNSGAQDPDMYKSFRAVDGNDSTEESDCAQTTNGTVSWWLVDLYALLHIRGVAILNTNDKLGQYPDFIVDVFEQDPRMDSNFLGLEGTRCPFSFDPFGEEEWVEIDCSSYGTVSGRFIRVMKIGNERLSLCEVRAIEYGVTGLTLPSRLIPIHITPSSRLILNHLKPSSRLIPSHFKPTSRLTPLHITPTSCVIPNHFTPTSRLTPLHITPSSRLVPSH